MRQAVGDGAAEVLSAEGLVGELALSGRLEPQELARWLAPLGIGEKAAVLVFAAADPQVAAPLLEGLLSRAGVPALVTVCDGLLCAIVACPPGATSDPGRESDDAVPRSARAGRATGAGEAGEVLLALASHARHELRERLGEVRAAVSRPAGTEALRNSFYEARCALAVALAANGDAPEVASYADLGAVQLLLSLQDAETLASYCRTVLGPVEAEEGEYGEELLRSLDVFIEHNGHWEHAARALYCHRHTLRYRVRRVEQLTGRDFSNARDRIEFWLALRGRELAR
jgi:PucR family transcriptional regulator, purine catabolism regulatory protein